MVAKRLQPGKREKGGLNQAMACFCELWAKLGEMLLSSSAAYSPPVLASRISSTILVSKVRPNMFNMSLAQQSHGLLFSMSWRALKLSRNSDSVQ